MSKQPKNDPLKEKFRPDIDAKLDQEINDALEGISLDDLYDADRKSPGGESGAPASDRAKGTRRGKIVSISKDDVFVDFGGKSQGIASLVQFEKEPKVGDEMEFNVDRYDAREGLLILSLKGAAAANVTWERLEVG